MLTCGLSMTFEVPARRITEVRKQRVHTRLILNVACQKLRTVILLRHGVNRPHLYRSEGRLAGSDAKAKNSVIDQVSGCDEQNESQ